MKKLLFAGVVALASLSVACGGPITEDETNAEPAPITDEAPAAAPDSGEAKDDRLITAALSCAETYTCEPCTNGNRSKRTYYARQEWIWTGSSWWLFCSDLRTQYGACGVCAQ